MCRTEVRHALGAAVLALLASACSREAPRTVVCSIRRPAGPLLFQLRLKPPLRSRL